MLGMLALFIGSALFGIATLRAETLSRWGAALLALSGLVVLPVMAGIGGGLPEVVGLVIIVLALLSFAGGWVVLGVSALRAGGAVPKSIQGAMS
jgi:hypothetical protein